MVKILMDLFRVFTDKSVKLRFILFHISVYEFKENKPFILLTNKAFSLYHKNRYFMRIKLTNLYIFLIFPIALTACISGSIAGEEKIDRSITSFFFIEIMNGNKDLSFRDGEDGVIKYFGKPLKIEIESVSFYFESEKVVEIQKLTYDDFVHYYYVFENGKKLYNGFIIENKLKRLKSINIGDTSEKLLSTFYDKYISWDDIESIKENISYYTDPVECEIQFVINKTIIEKIYVNFLLI
jgi:hypothetical protein